MMEIHELSDADTERLVIQLSTTTSIQDALKNKWSHLQTTLVSVVLRCDVMFGGFATIMRI